MHQSVPALASQRYLRAAPTTGRLKLLIFLLLAGYLGWSNFNFDSALAVFDRPTAVSTYALLNMLGMPAVLDWTTLMHPAGFAYQIENTCTALFPTAIIFAFLLVSPVSGQRVALGTLFGAAFITAVNSFRLIGLYYVGVNHSQQFDAAHDWAGQGLMVAATLAFLVFWTRRPGLNLRL